MTDKDIVGLVFVMLIGWLIYEWLWVSPVQRIGAPKEDTPSYISDMERELSTTREEQEISIEVLRTEISKVVAREIPRAIKAGKDYIDLELNLAEPKYSSVEVSLIITPSQLNLLKLYSMQNEWAKKNLIDPKVAKHISDVRLYASSVGDEEYARFTAWVIYQQSD